MGFSGAIGVREREVKGERERIARGGGGRIAPWGGRSDSAGLGDGHPLGSPRVPWSRGSTDGRFDAARRLAGEKRKRKEREKRGGGPRRAGQEEGRSGRGGGPRDTPAAFGI